MRFKNVFLSIVLLLSTQFIYSSTSEVSDDASARGHNHQCPCPKSDENCLRIGCDDVGSFAFNNRIISKNNVNNLKTVWETPNEGSVFGFVIKDDIIYYGEADVTDLVLKVHARNINTGQEIWSVVKRDSFANFNTPLLVEQNNGCDILIVSDLLANIHAFDAKNGNLLWQNRISDQPQALHFGSPIFVEGQVIAPSDSGRIFATMPDPNNSTRVIPVPNSQLTFFGQIRSFDISDGSINWTFDTVRNPDVPGSLPTDGSGVGSFSAAVVDKKRGFLYIGTSQALEPNNDTPLNQVTLDDVPILATSLIALNYRTTNSNGEIVWTQKINPDRISISNINNIIDDLDAIGAAGDNDVGGVPNLFQIKKNGKCIDVVGVKNKDTIYKAFDRDTGKLIWQSDELGVIGSVHGSTSAAVANGKIFTTVPNDAATTVFNLFAGFAFPYLQQNVRTLVLRTKNGFVNVNRNQALSAVAPVIKGIYDRGFMNTTLSAINQSDGKLIWKRNLPGHTYSAPTHSNGMVFMIDSLGFLRAFDECTGKLIFERTLRAIPGTARLGDFFAPIGAQDDLLGPDADGNAFVPLNTIGGAVVYQDKVIVGGGGAFTLPIPIDMDINSGGVIVLGLN